MKQLACMDAQVYALSVELVEVVENRAGPTSAPEGVMSREQQS